MKEIELMRLSLSIAIVTASLPFVAAVAVLLWLHRRLVG